MLARGHATAASGGAIFCSASASDLPTLEIFDEAAPAGGGDACYPYLVNTSDSNTTTLQHYACTHKGVYLGPGTVVDGSTSEFGGGGAVDADHPVGRSVA